MRTILTEAEFKVLSEFSKGGSLTQRELARRLNLGLGTINYVLKSLIKKKIALHRQRDRIDKFLDLRVEKISGIIRNLIKSVRAKK
jgi:DNA-binding MarR family transcriptional regulator